MNDDLTAKSDIYINTYIECVSKLYYKSDLAVYIHVYIHVVKVITHAL